MPKIQIEKLITKDLVGANYLSEIMLYNPILKSHIYNIFKKIQKSDLWRILILGYKEYSFLYKQYSILKQIYKKTTFKELHRVALFDALYLNGIYTFWNCFINNGALEDFFIKEFNEKKLDCIETLTKLSQKYAESIFSNPMINLKITLQEIDIQFNEESKGRYVINEKLDRCYFYFVNLQKLFSKFNIENLFPLFKKISGDLSLPNYAPDFYKTLIKDYKEVFECNLTPGVIHIKRKLYDFNKNKLFVLNSKFDQIVNKLLQKNKITLLSSVFSELQYLKDRGLFKKYDLNKNLRTKYRLQKTFFGTLHLELSNACNYNCIHCFNRGQVREQKITFNDYKKIIDWFATKGIFYTILFGGEPLLNPDFVDIVKYLYKKKFPIEVFTNASLISPQILSKIKNVPIFRYRISLEGSKRINDYIRGKGSFDKTIAGIRLLKKYSTAPINLSVTLSADNKNEIGNIFKIAKKEKIDGIGFGLLVPIGKSKNSKKMLSPAEAFVADRSINSFSKKFGVKAGLAHFCENPLIYEESKNRFVKASPCGIGYNMFYVRGDGYIVPCPELTDRKWGVHFSKLSEEKDIRNFFCPSINNLRYVHTSCSNCGLFYLCFGSCKAKMYNLFGDFFKCDLYEKKRNEYLFSKIGEKYGTKRYSSK